MTRLRAYAPMPRVSEKRRALTDAWVAVYREVDERSGGRCEVIINNLRCPKRAVDHHHLVKPRASHHTAALVVHLCRAHHERCEWPYSRGRLVWDRPLISVDAVWDFRVTRRFLFSIAYQNPKRSLGSG